MANSKRSAEDLAARAIALRTAADAIQDPARPPFGLNSDLTHAAAVDEVRRAKAAMLRRAEALWAECGKRHLQRTAHTKN